MLSRLRNGIVTPKALKVLWGQLHPAPHSKLGSTSSSDISLSLSLSPSRRDLDSFPLNFSHSLLLSVSHRSLLVSPVCVLQGPCEPQEVLFGNPLCTVIGSGLSSGLGSPSVQLPNIC